MAILWEIYENIYQCNSKFYFTFFSCGDDHLCSSFGSWGNQTRSPKKGISRLIQTFTLHRAHDGYESKRHFKIVLEILGEWSSFPFFLPFSKAYPQPLENGRMKVFHGGLSKNSESCKLSLRNIKQKNG